MRFVSSCITDIGKKRSNNEDWILEWPEKGLYIVADGMGGGKHGEVAAQLAVDTLERHIIEHYAVVQAFRLSRSPENRQKVLDLIAEGATRANTVVWNEADKSGSTGKMGTTLTALLAIDTEGFVIHVGDSRLYLIRNAAMTQLTTDHTMRGDYERKYGAAPDGLDGSLSNTLTRAVGLCDTIEVETRNFEIRLNDRFLLCSDGVHRYFDEARVAELTLQLAVPGIDAFEEKRFLDREIKSMMDAIYRAGAEDNFSVLLVTAREADEETAAAEKLLDVAGVARSLPLFSGFNEEQIERLVLSSEVRAQNKYDILSFPIHPEGELLIMLEGQVSVLRKSRQIEALTTGSLIGEVSFFSGKPMNYTLFVDKPSTFIVVRRSIIKELLEESPGAAAKFLWEICRVMADQILTSVSHIEKK
ncbi:MAG TPA: protein phosphatase 2C domain-containing protein [bacterium]|nr:protein phosphatase 2C domain-containing protein [bacterium]